MTLTRELGLVEERRGERFVVGVAAVQALHRHQPTEPELADKPAESDRRHAAGGDFLIQLVLSNTIRFHDPLSNRTTTVRSGPSRTAAPTTYEKGYTGPRKSSPLRSRMALLSSHAPSATERDSCPQRPDNHPNGCRPSCRRAGRPGRRPVHAKPRTRPRAPHRPRLPRQRELRIIKPVFLVFRTLKDAHATMYDTVRRPF
jgi:hypothetical protein